MNITGLGHTYPADVEILLVSPAGTAVLLMNDACEDWGGFVYDFTFDDEAAAQLSNGNGCASGSYRPTSHGATSFTPPAPAGPYELSLSAFDGEDPNGSWSLYVFDDADIDYGDLLEWSLEFSSEEIFSHGFE